jgi:hypothetical protein
MASASDPVYGLVGLACLLLLGRFLMQRLRVSYLGWREGLCREARPELSFYERGASGGWSARSLIIEGTSEYIRIRRDPLGLGWAIGGIVHISRNQFISAREHAVFRVPAVTLMYHEAPSMRGEIQLILRRHEEFLRFLQDEGWSLVPSISGRVGADGD